MSAAPPPIIGRSPALREAVALLERFARTGLPILLVGATGTGKELFARHVHYRSGRRGELVDVDCGAMPRDMVEGLLFGCRRGAFTGAVEDRAGLIEAAHEGTLFLDELASLPEEGQRKLLRVLDTNEVRRLGETRNRAVNLRVVAAMQDGVRTGTETGALRRDLYQRIAGVVIHLPPLAQRPEDIALLARHFAAERGGVLAPDAESALDSYAWPGNARELCKAIERAAALAADRCVPRAAVVRAIALGAPVTGATRSWRSPALSRHTDERERLSQTCRDHGGDVGRAAMALGMSRATLYRRLRVLGVSLTALRVSLHENSQRNSHVR